MQLIYQQVRYDGKLCHVDTMICNSFTIRFGKLRYKTASCSCNGVQLIHHQEIGDSILKQTVYCFDGKAKYYHRLSTTKAIIRLIVSITKSSLVSGSARAYLLRNCSAHGYPITTLSNWIAVIGQFRCLRVNNLHWTCFSTTYNSDRIYSRCFHYKWKRICSRIVYILAFCYWYD